jgi:hypothetical protein
MSSSDAQPPLSRRQARERERAGGAQPVTPPPTIAPADPQDGQEARRRPGSHVAPASAAPAQAAGPAAVAAQPSSPARPGSSGAASTGGVPSAPPGSAVEIVPGTGGMSRRQLRLLREAQQQAVRPVPLQNPTPHSSDRTVKDVLGGLAGGTTPAPDAQVPSVPPTSTEAPLSPTGFAGTAAPRRSGDGQARPASADALAPTPDDVDDSEESGTATPVSGTAADPVPLDRAAVEQATSADGSPDAIEPLDAAAAHAEEPRRHRTTWAPYDADPDEVAAAESSSAPEVDSGAGADSGEVVDPVVVPSAAPDAVTPGVFPLDLDDDTAEVAVPETDPTPSAQTPMPEPKPITTAFEAPSGHWSTLAHDSNDAEVHDEETGTRRVAETRSSAIILPNSALADPTGALNATGEVILTGSIDLPSSLSSTGSHRPIDGAEVDRLLEQHDEQPDTDASPVRASKAVSSHTSTRQVVLAAAKPKDSRTPVILAVSASVVAVAAAAVIVVAFAVTNGFGG